MAGVMAGQLGLFGEPDPQSCPHEAGRYGTKTECTFSGRPVWTNCREAGHCVYGGEGLPEEVGDDD